MRPLLLPVKHGNCFLVQFDDSCHRAGSMFSCAMFRTLIHSGIVLILISALTHCGAGGGSAGPSRGIQVVNVSAYDPKEKQRQGRSYSPGDVSALRANGAAGLIARCGKGGVLDEKCSPFLSSADRSGMLVGVYYRTIHTVDTTAQADQFVNRVASIRNARAWGSDKLLLCADFDTDSSPAQMVRFLDRVKQRTGVNCMVYLENSEKLRVTLSRTDETTKQRLRSCPYWAALYSHDSGACTCFPAPGTPTGLTRQYDVWKNWSLWQYGGVAWENGRSAPKVYRGFSSYLGDLDRPVERNLFRGDYEQLKALWGRHGVPLR